MKTLNINNFTVQLLSKDNACWASVSEKKEQIQYRFARRFNTEDEAVAAFTKFLNIKKRK